MTTTTKLYARINGELVEAPEGAIAYKRADPTEDARWIHDLSDRREVESEDRSLIVDLSEMGSCNGCGDNVLLSEAVWIDGTPFCSGCGASAAE